MSFGPEAHATVVITWAPFLTCTCTIRCNSYYIIYIDKKRMCGLISNKKNEKKIYQFKCRIYPTHWDKQACVNHYENMPVQIYRKSPPKTEKNSDKKTLILFFHISAQNIDCGYSLERPQSMFLSRNKQNNAYSCKPQFYDIKVGFPWQPMFKTH